MCAVIRLSESHQQNAPLREDHGTGFDLHYTQSTQIVRGAVPPVILIGGIDVFKRQ